MPYSVLHSSLLRNIYYILQIRNPAFSKAKKRGKLVLHDSLSIDTAVITMTMAMAIRFTFSRIGKNITSSNIYISQGPNPRKTGFQKVI
jgi:hypothetical protein